MKYRIIALIFFTQLTFAQVTAIEDKDFPAYEKADLKTKFALNKTYAAQILPILSSYQTTVDEKFKGVRNFGNKVAATNFNVPQNVFALTSANSDYWRAVMEMESRNELIPVTKIYMLVSQGEFDHAWKYFEMASLVSKNDTYADAYLLNLQKRLQLFNTELAAAIQKGIVAHDKGDFEAAIAVYDDVIAQYPNSSWAHFERFYAQTELNNKNGNAAANSYEHWEKITQDVFGHNPLYNVQISAKDPLQAYLLYRRNSIDRLFADHKNLIKDMYEYGNIALDLEIYDFAAQMFWYAASFSDNKAALYKFLYCLEKLGVKDLKRAFKGDFTQIFKDIDREKEKQMKDSAVYKKAAKSK